MINAIKAFLVQFYETPEGRLTRRFAVAGLSAALALFLVKIPTVEPLGFIDGILALTAADYTEILKVFIGAGVLSGLDKLRRELPNIKVDNDLSEK